MDFHARRQRRGPAPHAREVRLHPQRHDRGRHPAEI